MSARTVSGFARYLPAETRERINSLVTVDYSDYAANAESKLRALGEHALADQMLEEIEMSREEERAAR